MTAVEVLPYNASREEWLAARVHGIGGSDIAAVLGMSRWASPRDVWLDKTGRGRPKPQTWAMTVGNALEEPLLRWFQETSGIMWQRRGLLQDADRPWMIVSLDAETGDGGIAECKSVGFRLADEWDGSQVADNAELQVQWGLAITGRSHAWVIAAIGGNEPTVRRVGRNDELIAVMTERAERFWHDHVLADVEPPLIARDAETIKAEYARVERELVLGNREKLAPAFERRHAATTAIKFHQAAKDQAEAEIVQALADAEQLVIDGQVWATRNAQTSRVLSADLLAEAGLNPDDYKATRTSRVLRVADPNKRKDVA